jgi:molecular chaperone GrpE
MMSEIDPQSPVTENVSGNISENPENLEMLDADNEPEATEAQVQSPEAEVMTLTSRLAELTEQKDAAQNQYVRIAADFDNFRKRTAKEKEELEQRIKCNTITDVLSVVDNFERARTQIKPQNDGELEIHKSYQGVYKQLVDTLKKSGVSPMRPEGQMFDPNLHEAVMRQPTEEHPEGTVIEELQRGYFLGEKILRHALVKVAAPIEQKMLLPDSKTSSLKLAHQISL